MECIKAFWILCIIIIAERPVSASFLSWFTGGSPTTASPLEGRPAPGDLKSASIGPSAPGDLKSASIRSPVEYPEETGECSHWGNAGIAPFGMSDPLFDLSKGMALPGELIGSHRHLPIGTIVTVTNTKNGQDEKTVRVRVVPPKTTPVVGRIMDMSPSAFAQIENLREGVFTCTVRVIQTPRTEMVSLTSHTFDNGMKFGPMPFVPKDTSGYGHIQGLDMLGRSEKNEQYEPHFPVSY